MAIWWESLNLLGQIFVCIAIPATVILVIQLILSLIGIGGDSDVDHDMGHDMPDHDFDADTEFDAETGDGIFGTEDPSHEELSMQNLDSGIKLFTVRGLVAFFAICGWTGALMAENDIATPITILVAVAAGFLSLVLVALFYRLMSKMQSDGTQVIRNAVGLSGTVYLTIPAKRMGYGKINVLLQSSYSELEAVTDEETDILSGEEIVVVSISGGNTTVVKRK